ncbi:xanthine dehydrogenase accessory protein XdhC [Roseibium sediminis]|uniref:xanthine dehydrogenase accessory protein XdhC n=1 Tax=Roseibium sediminis TaxID=1775174 RepID=UPI00123DE80D|nr:xanthine dehydrogenase accessory protein XdhC [Roseibium sediminis]
MIVWGHIARLLEQQPACVLVTVASVAGSTPREVGARMIVREDGGYHGTIGGGTLEFEAIRIAREALRQQETGLRIRRMSLGPDLGQCCGGSVEMAFEVVKASQLEAARQFAELEYLGGEFSTVAKVADGPLIRGLVAETGTKSRFTLKDGDLTETFGQKRQSVFLFGAGHVGKAVVLALAPLPFRVTWIDSRIEIFPAAVPANVQMVHQSRPECALESAPDGAFVLAMTHCHAMDEEIMAAALMQQRFALCGVIGSKTKRARFRKRLKQRGLSDSLLSEMVCPIGVPTIRSKHPAAIAAGIAVDLLQREETAHQQADQPEGLENIRTFSR